MRVGKTTRWLRSATAVALAAAVAMGGAQTAIAQPTPLEASQLSESTAALRSLVNPVLQSYAPLTEGGTWKLGAASRLVIEVSDESVDNERLAEVVRLANAELVDKGIVNQELGMVYGLEGDVAAQDVFIRLAPVSEITDQSSSDEAYKIDITADGVIVTGASENAVLYALHTIEALAQTSEGGLPLGQIVDWPDLAERRLFVDCGRKYFSKDWFIRQIREMSYMKLNTMDLHFSENLGFRIECETDPAIVSDEHLTKAEVLEILDEARAYGIKVIPSIDSPGHVDQILRAHPEYGQVANDGTHLTSGLDITNPEAVAYMRSIYQEYIDLFKQGGTTTDISIGCDEYMEFDRAPFTTKYQSVLNDWAHENLGPEYCWTDTLATYINGLAEFCVEQGLQPRVFNDGLYYGLGTRNEQKVQTHSWIGVDFWSQMSWNRNIANLRALLNKGYGTIYNFNANFAYFVLRNNERGASFDFDNNDKSWFEEWTPGNFQDRQNQGVLADDDERIKGTAIAIWCDYPDVATEEEVMEGIASSLRAMATRSWNVDSNKDLTFDEFRALTDKLGHAAAWDKGSELPKVGDILAAGNVGKVTLHFVDESGAPVADDKVSYGEIGKAFELAAPQVYGYRLMGETDAARGTYAKEEASFTFVYELHTDRSELAAALAAAPLKDESIAETYTALDEALAAAQAVYADAKATQAEVDEALEALTQAAGSVVALDRYALYVEATYPLSGDDYASGVDAYRAAVEAGSKLLAQGAGASDEACAEALAAIRAAKAGLTKPVSDRPEVSATDDYYRFDGGYPYSNMLDGNLATKCWFNKDQAVGSEVVFTFPATVSLSGVQIVQPDTADIIGGADVQVASSASGAWETVGHIDSSQTTWDVTFPERTVKKVRLVLTVAKKNWYQISEVTFASTPLPEDTTLADAIRDAEDLGVAGKSAAAAQKLVAALIDAQKALTTGEGDAAQALAALQEARAAFEADDGTAVDKDELRSFVERADDLVADGYTAESWRAFEEAREAAHAVLGAEGQKQAAVNAALAALRDAYYGLVVDEQGAPEVDKSALTELVAAAEKLQEGDYTAESWKPFAAALSMARDVLDDEDATQEEVAQAAEGLTQAMDALRSASGETPDPDPEPDPEPAPKPGSGQKPSSGQKPDGGSDGRLPETGDASIAAVAVLGLAGASALGYGLRRKRS